MRRRRPGKRRGRLAQSGRIYRHLHCSLNPAKCFPYCADREDFGQHATLLRVVRFDMRGSAAGCEESCPPALTRAASTGYYPPTRPMRQAKSHPASSVRTCTRDSPESSLKRRHRLAAWIATDTPLSRVQTKKPHNSTTATSDNHQEDDSCKSAAPRFWIRLPRHSA
jgi:hypothetical protein